LVERLGPKVLAHTIRHGRVIPVKCDICDEEFANSVELEKHKEREHPMGDDEELEKPDHMQEEMQSAPVVPGKS
jgi:hypothetical protein